MAADVGLGAQDALGRLTWRCRRRTSNLLTAVVITSFHVQVQYALHLLPFLGFTLILGLFFGYLMQRSGSLLGPVLFHAGSDIPIFLAYLSYVSSQ